jgi:hypothetical protein
VRLPLTRDPRLWNEAVRPGPGVLWASTYGERYVAPADGRPEADASHPQGDPRRVRYHSAVGQELPAEIKYAEMTETLHLGSGQFGLVPPEVGAYDVGIMQRQEVARLPQGQAKQKEDQPVGR